MKSSFLFGISETSQCSFCNQNNETIEHFFCHCFVAKALWNGLNTFFENHLSLYDLTPQAAFFGFTEKNLDDTILQIIYYWCLKYICINQDLMDLFA